MSNAPRAVQTTRARVRLPRSAPQFAQSQRDRLPARRVWAARAATGATAARHAYWAELSIAPRRPGLAPQPSRQALLPTVPAAGRDTSHVRSPETANADAVRY